jgi:hypothetical protein
MKMAGKTPGRISARRWQLALERRSAQLLVVFVALVLPACSPALAVREPIAMSAFPADSYAASNMVIVGQVRMALPNGWRFKGTKKGDPEDIRFFIRDTGSNTLTGALRHTHFDFPVAAARVAEVYAQKAMSKFTDKEIRKAEIDGRESYVVQGTWGSEKQRASALIQQGTQGISDITLLADPGYFTRDPQIAYTIFNSYKFMPMRMSERRIKGAFGFRCHDGSLSWFDDADAPWESKGYYVSGRLGGEFVVLGITQVSTTRFPDFFKMDKFGIPEFSTDIHFAGQSYAARAIGNVSEERKSVRVIYLFKHAGTDYRMEVYRARLPLPAEDAKRIHEDPEIRRALDEYFYFDG